MKKCILTFLLLTNFLFGLEWFSLSMNDCGLGYINNTESISVQSSLINPALNYKGNQININYTPVYSGFGITEFASNLAFNFGAINPNIHILSQQYSKMNNSFISIDHSIMSSEKMKIGVAIEFNHASIKDYSNYNSMSGSAGIVLTPHKVFKVGFSYLHFYEYQFNKNELALIDPTVLFGLSVLPVEKIDVFVSIVKSQYLPWSANVGIKLQHWDFFYYSFAYESFSEIIKGGINFEFKNFNIQESVQWHLELGLSHSLSLYYSF
ncbi:MAG: hypothetical protein U9N76_06850 [Candidatus Marinimicrobia bacterium]|nr:hypothetical protein [Candidatus Neomarinimicrobiota bacterium]